METQLIKELREWLIYWIGSALGIIVIGTLCAVAHHVVSLGVLP